MSAFFTLIVFGIYFLILILVSFLVGRKSDNAAFFLGNRKSSWWVVAIGMVGASLSGITFISVPGLVRGIDFTYMQTVFGFMFGYIVVANVLLPLYYRLNLTTIYSYLESRFGRRTYKTGASFFLLSKTIGAAARLYVVALILQKLIFDAWEIPFVVTVLIILVLIWIYTFRSGMKTIIWTDLLQTVVFVSALIFIIIQVVGQLDMNLSELTRSLIESDKTRIFVFDDWHSKQNFFKQFFSGVFIVIVMTGLDQDMMQKNLTCKNLSAAKKNMISCGFMFIPVSFIFLLLGALLLMLSAQNNIPLPASSDEILPLFATQYLGQAVFIVFSIGIVAAAFSSADSALTALTTSFYIDILGKSQNDDANNRRTRIFIHLALALLFVLIILFFKWANSKSLIDTIYVIVSYSYGPLLGIYAFGLCTKLKARDRWVPYIAVASPLFSYLLNLGTSHFLNYSFGYELLMINGLFTFLCLWATKEDVKMETVKL